MAITNWLKPEEPKDFIVARGAWAENTSEHNLDFWIVETLVNFAKHSETPKEMLFVSTPVVRDRITAKARQWARLDEGDGAIICATAFAIHDAFNACLVW